MIIPDVNLLVYAYNSDAPFHPSAKRWWEGCVGGSQPVAIPWVVALGFVRLMTSRAVLQHPMEVAPYSRMRTLLPWPSKPRRWCIPTTATSAVFPGCGGSTRWLVEPERASRPATPRP